jgi:hypothetical protein
VDLFKQFQKLRPIRAFVEGIENDIYVLETVNDRLERFTSARPEMGIGGHIGRE